MIPAHQGVAERGALLRAAVDHTDKRVDIDNQPPVARFRARLPRTSKRLAEDAIM